MRINSLYFASLEWTVKTLTAALHPPGVELSVNWRVTTVKLFFLHHISSASSYQSTLNLHQFGLQAAIIWQIMHELTMFTI